MNQDILQPEVVADFAREVKSQMRLDYLYALTVADINATNPTLWNGWRNHLMRRYETRRVWTRKNLWTGKKVFKRFKKVPWISSNPTCRTCRRLTFNRFGRTLAKIFFLRHDAEIVMSLSKRLLAHDDNSAAFVGLFLPQTGVADEGATRFTFWIKTGQNVRPSSSH